MWCTQVAIRDWPMWLSGLARSFRFFLARGPATPRSARLVNTVGHAFATRPFNVGRSGLREGGRVCTLQKLQKLGPRGPCLLPTPIPRVRHKKGVQARYTCYSFPQASLPSFSESVAAIACPVPPSHSLSQSLRDIHEVHNTLSLQSWNQSQISSSVIHRNCCIKASRF